MRSRGPLFVAILGALSAAGLTLALGLSTDPTAKPLPPLTREIVWKGALRSCNEGSAAMSLLHLDQEDRGRLMLERSTAFLVNCGDRKSVLGLAFRAACDSNDTGAALVLRARLAAAFPDAGGWLLHPCPVLEGLEGQR